MVCMPGVWHCIRTNINFLCKARSNNGQGNFTRFQHPTSITSILISLSSIIIIPIYDWVFVPITRALTRKPSGITVLQRIGTGLFLSILSMLMAGVIEQEFGLIDEPNATVPTSIWCLIPQYFLHGVSEVSVCVGLQGFFYDQVPNELRSVGISLYLSIIGVGNFLSSFMVSIIEKVTGGKGHDSWFANNFNRGHVDYFYWLNAGLSIVQLFAYVYFAKIMCTTIGELVMHNLKFKEAASSQTKV